MVQIFGTKKCADTRKAERFFKERGVKVQFIDLADKGISPGELRSVAARLGGLDNLVDKEGKRYVERGLKFSSFSPAGMEKLLLEDPLLLKTPIVRCGKEAAVGHAPEAWKDFA